VLGRACDLQAQPETVLPALVARLWLQACAVDVAQLSLVLRMPEPHTLGLCPRTTEVRMTLPRPLSRLAPLLPDPITPVEPPWPARGPSPTDPDPVPPL